MSVDPALPMVFQEEYRALRPRAPMPPFDVRFRRFTGLNTTIRLREGAIKVHLSDLLEGAPDPVLRAIAHILLAKLYRKPIEPVHAGRYDLDEVFESVNARFFHGLLGRPLLTWSEHVAKRCLGHYDAAHNTIMVSKVFDRRSTPRYAVEYLMYHEMLHLKHPVKVKAGRRCVHSRDFKAEENLFPELAKAKEYLKRL